MEPSHTRWQRMDWYSVHCSLETTHIIATNIVMNCYIKYFIQSVLLYFLMLGTYTRRYTARESRVVCDQLVLFNYPFLVISTVPPLSIPMTMSEHPTE